MAESPAIHALVAVHPSALADFRDHLARDSQLALTFVTSEGEAHARLADPRQHTDVLVIDNRLGDVYALVRDLRQTYPRLLIVLVDQEADFGMPGYADEISVAPFHDDDLLRRIKRLVEERRLETLRADALPPVRAFAKALRRAGPGVSEAQAAVDAIRELGYDYVAFYHLESAESTDLKLKAQVGPEWLKAIAPQQQEIDTSLVGWVSQNGQSRVVGPDDDPNHPFVRQGRYGTGACVPVGVALRFGVILACREQPQSITDKHVLILETVCAQLAGALARQARA